MAVTINDSPETVKVTVPTVHWLFFSTVVEVIDRMSDPRLLSHCNWTVARFASELHQPDALVAGQIELIENAQQRHSLFRPDPVRDQAILGRRLWL